MSSDTPAIERSAVTSSRRPIGIRVGRDLWIQYAWVSMFILPVMTFTMPGRPSPSATSFLDPLALVKLMILCFTVFGGSAILFLNRHRREFRDAVTPLVPFFVFLAWAISTVLWTPLKSVSLGQAGGLAALLMLSTVVGALCREPAMVSRVLRTLSLSLLAFSLFVFVVYLKNPQLSGLDRSYIMLGGDGLIHPTAAGSGASLGLMLAFLCWAVGRFPWAWKHVLAAVAIHVPILYWSHSRAATLMAAITIAISLFVFSNNRRRAIAMLAFAVIATGYLCFDPGFHILQDSAGASLSYLSRGQSVDQLRDVSGRAEMWAAIWDQYQHARITGHGYFVTSPTGEVYVWNKFANHTAHNIFLQVLVSTGIIGFIIFLIALLEPAVAFARFRAGDLFASRLLWMLGIVAIWYLGWSVGCASFMGPMRGESVVFFTFLGIGIGQLSRLPKPA